MHNRRIGTTPRWRRGLLATVSLTVTILIGLASPASATTEGLSFVEDTVFTVLDESVRVDVVVTMINTTRDERRGNTIYYTYFDEFFVPVPIGATDVSIESRGRSLEPTYRPLDRDFELLTASLPSDLRAGESRAITISYSLPVGELRSEGLFLSNPAFHSFPLYSFSDPGTGSLELVTPTGAAMTEFGGALRVDRVTEGAVVWVPEMFDVPTEFFTYVTVRIDEALDSTDLTAAGQDIVLESWPDDVEWVQFASETIMVGLPKLEELIGLDVPDQETLEVTESVTPYFYGYAGWYDPEETTIEVGNELDDSVMLHELSHAWFNAGLFSERWIAEGLAEEFTWQAQRDLGWETDPLPTEPRAGEGAQHLVDWGEPTDSLASAETFEAREACGYNASLWTMRRIVETAGLDAVQDAIGSAHRDEISYLGHAEPETVEPVDDWRRFLDLVSERSARLDVDEALVDLFRDQVVAPEADDELADRAAARDAYADLVSHDVAWTASDGIRRALNDWRFDAATSEIIEATAVLDRYAEVSEMARLAGLELSDQAEQLYEADPPQYESSLDVLGSQAASIPIVEDVRLLADTELSRWQRWGIGDTDLDVFVASAEAAFASDDPDRIASARAQAELVLSESERLGRERARNLGVATASVVGFLVAWSIVVSRRRTRVVVVAPTV